jgi:hypothetical protein
MSVDELAAGTWRRSQKGWLFTLREPCEDVRGSLHSLEGSAVLAALCWCAQRGVPWRGDVEPTAKLGEDHKSVVVLMWQFAFSVVLAAVCWSALRGVPWRGIVEPAAKGERKSVGCSLYGRAMRGCWFSVWEWFVFSVVRECSAGCCLLACAV